MGAKMAWSPADAASLTPPHRSHAAHPTSAGVWRNCLPALFFVAVAGAVFGLPAIDKATRPKSAAPAQPRRRGWSSRRP